MRIETERLVIRDLERKDQEQLCKIVWKKCGGAVLKWENAYMYQI